MARKHEVHAVWSKSTRMSKHMDVVAKSSGDGQYQLHHHLAIWRYPTTGSSDMPRTNTVWFLYTHISSPQHWVPRSLSCLTALAISDPWIGLRLSSVPLFWNDEEQFHVLRSSPRMTWLIIHLEDPSPSTSVKRSISISDWRSVDKLIKGEQSNLQ